MASRQNLTGRGRPGGILRRVMNPRAPKITPPAELSGGTGATSRPRPKGLAGLVSRGVEAARTGEPLSDEATGLGGMVADAAKRSRQAAMTKPKPKNPARQGLAGRVASAVETARDADQPPRASGVGGMVQRGVEQAQAAAEEQAVVDPSLGGTTTEQPTRNLPRRSPASRSRRIRSEFD